MPRLLTLGHFELKADDTAQGAVVSAQPKRLALLVYLAVAKPRGFHRRDTLLGFFWPELGQDEARRALRQALYHLRQIVGTDAISTRSDDQVGLLQGTLSCDAIEFEGMLDSDDEAQLDAAVALYRGEFLAGLHLTDVSTDLGEWIEGTRSRLRLRAIDAAWRCAEWAEEKGKSNVAIDAARRAHELSPDDEVGLRRLLKLYTRLGMRNEGLEAHASFTRRRALDGKAPEAKTLAIVDLLLSAPVSDRVAKPSSALLGASAETATPASADRLPPAVTTGRGRAARWLWSGVAALALAGLSLGAIAFRAQQRDATLIGSGSLGRRDRVLVADFVTRTGDSTLGAAVAEALRVDLGQSPMYRVMTTAQVRGALRGMDRPLEVSLDDSLARAVALREGVKAFVTGDVSAVGASYVLSVRMVAALTGEELVTVRETAQDTTRLIEAIDRLSVQLRRRIGEGLRAVRADPPLAQVMTNSLEALRLYTRAMTAKDIAGDRIAAIRLLEEAVEVDTGFAMAYVMLGSTYAALADPGRAERALQRAFTQRERLPPRDRYLLMGSYYRNVTGEYASSAAAYRSLLALYPSDIAGLNNLGLVLFRQRQWAAAESLFRRVVAVDSEIPSVYMGLTQTLSMQGRHDDARLTLDGVWRRFPEFPATELTETYAAAARQDWPGAERHIRRRLAQARGQPTNEADALLTLGQIELVVGRLADAERDLLASMSLSAREKSPTRYYAGAIALAWLEQRYRGRAAQALARIDGALARFPLDSVAASDRPYGAVTELLVAAGQTLRARAMLSGLERDSAAVGRTASGELHAARGAFALGEGRGRDAVAEFSQEDAAQPCPVCALPALARAHEQADDVASAIATYERYLGTPWIWRFESDAPNLAWAHRRLGELYELHNKPHKAAEEYARLLRLWSNADAELTPAITEVRKRLDRLTRATATG